MPSSLGRSASTLRRRSGSLCNSPESSCHDEGQRDLMKEVKAASPGANARRIIMNVSYLYVPAARLDRVLANRRQVEANVIVLDVEDSTHLHSKAAARAKIADADLAPLTALGLELGIRINALTTFDGVRDLDMLRQVFERGD